METKTTSTPKWHTQRGWSLLFVAVGIGFIYLLLLRATDTGSLQQYGLALLLLVLVIARLNKVLQKEKI